jgi:predicted nuclease with TOPRIM domain
MTEPRSPTTKTGRIREWLAVLRESAILLFVALLLVWPSYIGRITNRVVEEAGIKSIAGIDLKDLKEDIEKSQKVTIAALDDAKELSSKSTQFSARLQAISKEKQPSPEAVKNLAKEVDALEQRSQEVKKSLENSLQVQRDIIKRIGK